MPLIFLKLAKWLLSKAVVLAVIGGISVGVFALWIYAQRSYNNEGSRATELSALQTKASEVYSELESVHTRLVELGDEIETTRKKIEAAEQVIKYFDGLLNRIERFITMSAAQRAESERLLAEAEAEKEKQSTFRKSLVGEQSTLRIDRVTLSEEAKQLESTIASLEDRSSGFIAYLEESWFVIKPYLLIALASSILVPIGWKLFAFFVWAPLLASAGPIRLSKEVLESPALFGSGVSIQVLLEAEQRLWVKESFLQASDESLKRKTRFLLDWSIPATCLAAGLVELIEFRGNGKFAGQVTVSPQRRAELEVALVEIPVGGEMVIRPSSVAGIVSRSGETVKIMRRWRLFHPQAWLTFQFRYFVFQGPCAVIVCGVRGVRFEVLNTSSEQGRRSNQVATIGFTPDLGYGVVRAETFWSYFRSFNPLFDDVFRGKGAFLCQEISEDDVTKGGRFWGGIWSGLLKVLGV